MTQKTYKPLPKDEIYAILRASDDLIAQGGRTLLAKMLKGSKDKKLLALGLDQNPSYGYFRHLTIEALRPFLVYWAIMLKITVFKKEIKAV